MIKTSKKRKISAEEAVSSTADQVAAEVLFGMPKNGAAGNTNAPLLCLRALL